MSIKQKIISISQELRLSKEGKNTFQKYDYFRPDDILIALNPLLVKNNLFMKFDLPYSHEKSMYEATLYFEDLTDEKQNITYKFDIPLTKVSGASEAQGAGATMTYAKRYSIMNVFSIADNNDDLDSKANSFFEKQETPFKKVNVSNTNEVCPSCKKEMIYKEGYNKVKKAHWRGYFCPNAEKGVNKCKQAPIWLPHKDQVEDEKRADYALDEIANKQEQGVEDSPY